MFDNAVDNALDSALDEEMITEINLTPLVDVSLVLVIIFMVVAPLFTNILKPLLLPAAANAGLTESNSIKISIFLDGMLAVGPTIVPASGVTGAIQKEIASGRPPWVLVRAATEVPHGRVMDVIQSVKRGGALRVGFAVQGRTAEVSH